MSRIRTGGEQPPFWDGTPNEEALSKEIREIQQTMMQGILFYELKYSVKVEKKWLRISIVDE